jgi:hypothetical protein
MRLIGSSEIDWVLNSPLPDFQVTSVFFGQGGAGDAMQVAVASAGSKPRRAELKALFLDRKGRLQIKLMVVVTHDESAFIFGPDPKAEMLELSAAVAEDYLNAVLVEPTGVLAYRRAVALRRAHASTDMSGFHNNGLFASHYLRTSTESHPKWAEAIESAKILKNLRHIALIEGLGFEVTSSPSKTLVLKAKGQDKRVVAVLLDHNESFDSSSPRFQATPVEWGLGMATEEGAPWLIAIRDSQIRLYPAKDGVGVGQKSQVETYFEVDLLTLDENKAALLPLIFSAEALAEDGTVDEFLKNSQKFASELGIRLRERVYESIVPVLSKEIANQLRAKGHQLDSSGLQLSYELTLRVLFRMLFQAYAEDRGLLPAGRNERFDKNSMKSWADDFLKSNVALDVGDSSSLWYDLMQVWDAIDQGSTDMQIPAYNGGLFGIDPELHPSGHLIRSLSIPDRVMKPALKALLIDELTEDGVAGKVDFRSLSVREFGTIYEGLLESSLSVAEQDLTVDKKGAWVPAKDGETILASANEVYFHSASGERKATGSYYTPSFVVDHLIERSVEPALKAHLAKVKIKVDAGDQSGAYGDFFDFRVADLAMGSAHFLVAAIDKIEAVMRSFLMQEGNRIDNVEAELLRLENAAKHALGDDEAAYAEIERSSLLRRQIARRCIYGLDINPLAVELSRLAIWIHTFVPGLPMSSLEHGLVCANSLTGIGSVEEGFNAFFGKKPSGDDFLMPVVNSSLEESRLLLIDLADADEAYKGQARDAAMTAARAREKALLAKSFFDLAVANRAKVSRIGAIFSSDELLAESQSEAITDFVDTTNPAHMPYLFPEVFLREDPGFDVVLGNPPWEELVADSTRFWASKMPGLLSMPTQKREIEIKKMADSRPDLAEELERTISQMALYRGLLQQRFNLGAGDADLYKAFGWVALALTRNVGSRIALVLPKTTFSAAGMKLWRRALQKKGSMTEITYLLNTSQWVFNIESRYSIALMVFESGLESDVLLRGPITNLQDFVSIKSSDGVHVSRDILLAFTKSSSIPLISNQAAAEVMAKMRTSSNLDEFQNGLIRPVTEFHATNDRKFFDHGEGLDRLRVLSGKSFNVWKPETGEFFAWADPQIVLPELQRRVARQLTLSSSAFFGMAWDKDLGGQLPMRRPRIAIRAVTRSTDSRTIMAALLPPDSVLTNIAPYLLFPIGKEKAEAYILGILSTRVFDWYARKFIETALNFHLFSAFPIPDLSGGLVFERISHIAGLLAAVDERYTGWASKVGVPVNSVGSPIERSQLVAELEALAATAYGLSAKDLTHIFKTFHRGWDHDQALAEALSHFELISTDLKDGE